MANSIFHKIKTPDGKISYLFGTLHAGDERVIKLPLEVKIAFVQAERYAFEVLSSPTQTEKLELQRMFDRWIDANNTVPVETSASHELTSARPQLPRLTDTEFARVYKFIKLLKPLYYPDFLFRQAFRDKPPIFLITMARFGILAKHCKMVMQADYLDRLLLKQAKSIYKKPITHLESQQFQLSAIAGLQFNYTQHLLYFGDVIAQLEKNENEITIKNLALLNAYIEGSLDAMQQFRAEASVLGKPETPSAQAVADRYGAALIHDRDAAMAAKMLPLLHQGKAFVAVGAPHLPHIIEKLRESGCTVTSVDLSKRLYSIQSFTQRNHKRLLATAGLFLAAVCCLIVGVLSFSSGSILSFILVVIGALALVSSIGAASVLEIQYRREPNLPATFHSDPYSDTTTHLPSLGDSSAARSSSTARPLTDVTAARGTTLFGEAVPLPASETVSTGAMQNPQPVSGHLKRH